MKLTLVSIYFNGKKYAKFINLPYFNGKAVLPKQVLNLWLDKIGVRRGDTYSIG